MSAVRLRHHPPSFLFIVFDSGCAVVAQLVRVPACHAGGRGFEPRPPRQILKIPTLGRYFSSARFDGFVCFGSVSPGYCCFNLVLYHWMIFSIRIRTVVACCSDVAYLSYQWAGGCLRILWLSFLLFCGLKCRRICRIFLKMSSEGFQTAFLSGGFGFADGEVEEGGGSGQQCVGIPHPAVVAESCNHDAADV